MDYGIAFRDIRANESGRVSPKLVCFLFHRSRRGSIPDTSPMPPDPALYSINADGLLSHIQVLGSDEFEGRAPGTKGEELSVNYITEQFKKLGLKPGNPDGTFTQRVPLAGITSEAHASFSIAGKRTELKYPDDFVGFSSRLQHDIKVDDSEVVFVGYGVVAPDYGWDDYKDVDVRGKTIVMLINDPAIPDPNDPSKLDDKMFKGNAMTYYGRWTYKYEIAAQKGAAAAVIVHETGPAAYPYSVVVNSWSKENYEIDAPNKNMDAVAVRSWISLETARKLCTDTGHNFEDLKEAALQKDFRPVSLGAKASFAVTNSIRKIRSRNVIAKLEGSDPKLKSEYIIYSAHWDHLGRDPKLAGDQIYNGALDNASGVATILEIARAFTKLDHPPKRSILFFATTAEEAGLLGAKFYVEHPLYPIAKTLADINIDGVNPWGRTRDLEDIGYGLSTLSDLLADAAREQHREAKPNSQPEKGTFYRADHFEFAKAGVPALYTSTGLDFIGRPRDYGREKRDDYTAHHYHQVSDEVDPAWDLSGASEDARLLFTIGNAVANGDRYPEWKPGSEFHRQR
ncbi:MAG: M28 family metallopeptidase [Verrucomicrobiota bacterium]|nr:M28 family metallopeptidase [Verrucomicrobiota bacterium]